MISHATGSWKKSTLGRVLQKMRSIIWTIHGVTSCGGERNFSVLIGKEGQIVNALLVFNRNPYFNGAQEAKMKVLAQGFKDADKVNRILD